MQRTIAARYPWIAVGAVAGLLGVALGAFGAHGLPDDLGAEQRGWWTTGAHYHLVHAVVLLAFGILRLLQPGSALAGWCFVAGIVMFSGSLYAMTLGAPRWFGAITPLGGVLLLLGWASLAVAGRRSALVADQE